MNPLQCKLGKAPARHDARTLRLGRYLRQLPAPPVAVDFAPKVESRHIAWGMLGNDAVGDCTCAAAGHMEMIWLANLEQPFVAQDEDILQAYSNITGYLPTESFSDGGAVVLDVLNYWRQIGIAGRRILGFAKIEPKNFLQVKQACWLFEGIYIGLQLPLSAQDDLDADRIWDVGAESELHGSIYEPGSWGGHAVNIVGYDAEGVTCVTWGKTQKMTWSFWAAYCDEAYAILSEDMLVDGESPAGFDLPKLRDELAAIGELPPQVPAPLPVPGVKRLMILVTTGLGTDPNGDCCGMRALAEKIAARYPDHVVTIMAVGWDQKPPAGARDADGMPYTAGPDGLCRWVKDSIIAWRPTKLVLLAHSFGGAYAVFFMQWLWNWYSGPKKDAPPFVFDEVILFDPVPNLVRFGQGQGPGWYLPLAVAPRQRCVYQRDGLIFGIKGEPVYEQGEMVRNFNVTELRDPRLGHVDWAIPQLTCLIKDERIHQMTLQVV